MGNTSQLIDINKLGRCFCEVDAWPWTSHRQHALLVSITCCSSHQANHDQQEEAFFAFLWLDRIRFNRNDHGQFTEWR